MNIQETDVVQNLLQSNDVFWMRSPDYATQLYISDSYTKVWQRSVEQLYQHPDSFNDSLVADQKTMKQMVTREKGQYISTQQIAFKIHTQLGIKHILDHCFDLYHCGEKIAVAGVAKEVSLTEWSCEKESVVNSLAGKNLDILSQVQDKLGVSLTSKNCLETMLSLLSKRQKECLHYTLLGKSAKEIGKLLNISHKTVEMHLSSIREKLFCNSKSELICKVVEAGYFRG